MTSIKGWFLSPKLYETFSTKYIKIKSSPDTPPARYDKVKDRNRQTPPITLACKIWMLPSAIGRKRFVG